MIMLQTLSILILPYLIRPAFKFQRKCSDIFPNENFLLHSTFAHSTIYYPSVSQKSICLHCLCNFNLSPMLFLNPLYHKSSHRPGDIAIVWADAGNWIYYLRGRLSTSATAAASSASAASGVWRICLCGRDVWKWDIKVTSFCSPV